MKQGNLKAIVLIFVVAAVMYAPCVMADAMFGNELRKGATAGQEPQPHKHLETSWLDGFHNPAEGWSNTLDFRFREVYGWNIDTLNDEAAGRSSKWHFERYRMRLGTKLNISEDIDLNSRLTWEFRTWDDPPTKPQHTDFDEILFDRLNFTFRNVFDMPLTVVAGRQDIILGAGWLVLDGTPLDGSRTIFMDALRATYDWAEKDTKIDMIYVDMAAASDRWLKPINDRDRHLTEQDERGVILYITNKSLENTTLEGYFIYKNDNPVDIVAEDFPSAAWSKKAEIYTYGAAISQALDENWKYRAEGALQRGDKQEQDLQAYGAKGVLEYYFNDEKNNALHLTYEYLSGDDPSTSKNEQFDPLWGEWPQWSELYIYTYSRETMIAETTNLHRLGIGHSFRPCPKWQLKTDYDLLWADDNNKSSAYTAGGFNYSDSGKFRGQLLTMWLTYKCCPQLSAHMMGEYFQPGDYYQDNTRDHAVFLRFNLEYTF